MLPNCRAWPQKGRVAEQETSSATMRIHLVLLVIAVAGTHVIHGEETIPSLQEVNHENVTNSSVIAEKRVARSDLGGQGESQENPPPFWANRGRSLNFNGERLRRHEPFFVDEPEWLVVQEQPQIPDENLDHRECEDSRKRRTSRLTGVDEAFWPSRGRRSVYKGPKGQDDKAGKGAQDLSGIIKIFHSPEDKFLVTKDSSKSHGEYRRLMNTQSTEEPFWAARGRSLFLEPRYRRSGFVESLEEPFWAARGRRSGDSARTTRSEAFSAEEPFWAARGRRSQDQRGKRLESFSGEEPFWAARGRRSEVQRGKRPESFSGEEPFWAARGRRSEDQRGKRPESFSGEEPFWAARGRRVESGVHISVPGRIPSQSINTHLSEARNPIKQTENKISEVARGRRSPFHIPQFSSAEEPFWAARGKRGFMESTSAEEPFWAARGKKQFPQVKNWNAKWWPFRETAAASVADNNAEDDTFWTALENKLLARGPISDMVPM